LNGVLHAWENFYFMLGSASAGLIGLLFVVVSLTSGSDRGLAMRGAKIYLTPTVLHFAIVLTVSAFAIAPGLTPGMSGVIIGGAAMVGALSAIRICVELRRGFLAGNQAAHWSDIWLYGAAPLVAYLPLLAAAVGLALGALWAANAIGALLLALVLLCIRNAWDLVTWLAPRRND